MSWFTGTVAYILIWWVLFFCMLPLRLRFRYDHDPAKQAPGTPDDPRLKFKFMLTTALAFVALGLLAVIISLELVDFRAIGEAMYQEDYGR